MYKRSRIQVALAVGALLVVGTAAAAFASGADRDSREVESYVLTDAALAKFAQASRNLRAHESAMPSVCDDDKDAKSLDALVARVDAIPAAKTAITSAGLTTREYVVFMFSLMQNGLAAWALDQPGGMLPPGVSMANVNFYRAHAATMKELGAATQATDCDDDRSEDDS